MSVSIKKDPKVSEKFNLAVEFLKEKDVKMMDIVEIRNSFSNWAKEYDDDIEFDGKSNYYHSVKSPSYCFETVQEVRMFNAMMEFLPDAGCERVIQLMGMIMKLHDIKSGWAYNNGSK